MVNTKLKCAGASDPGRVRRNNEDAWYIDAERGIFLVVDGIGGHAAGEKAAEIAVERVRARLERQTGTAEQRIREAITMANNEILRQARSNPDWQGMACVLTLVVLENGSAVVGHVGDSRLYEVRGKSIRKITHDHSPVGEREDSQELTEAEAMRHPRRNEVYRDVGSEEHQPGDPDFIELHRIPFEADSVLLLCSDGLSDQVPSGEIRQVVAKRAGDPEAAARELIEAANRAGGKDNVTVVIVEGDQVAAAEVVEADTSQKGSSFWSRIGWFMLGLLLAAAGAWFSRDLYVPQPVASGPSVLTVGRGHRFTNIAAALAEARDGDTVEVLPGEYQEQIKILHPVFLRSRVPREAILRAAPMSNGPAVLAQGITGGRMSGFWIQADAKTPLSAGIVLDDSSLEVDDVEISGAGVGIEIRGAASPILIGNAIRDSLGEGLLILGTSTPWVSHNSFLRNKGADIAARGGARPALLGNVFDRNVLELPPGVGVDTVRERNFFLEPPGRIRPSGRRASSPAPAEAKQ
jgi:serine/threonine protein phosphatase PrpC